MNYTTYPYTALYVGYWFRIITPESIQNWLVGQSSTFESLGSILNPLSEYGYDASWLRGELSLVSINSIPEPATLALFGIGLAGLGFARKKRSLYK